MTTETLPSWDLSSEYPSVNASAFAADFKTVEDDIAAIRAATETLRPSMGKSSWTSHEKSELIRHLVLINETADHAMVHLRNLSTFVNCEVSVDVKNAEAQKMYSKLQTLMTRLGEATKPSSMFLSQAPAEIFEEFIDVPAMKPSRFVWEMERKKAELLLSEAEESLIMGLRTQGRDAWGDLYDDLSGNLKIRVKHADGREETVGLAQAQAMTKLPDEAVRKAAWHGIQEAWDGQKESAAAILNALSGWRLEIAKRRSHRRAVDFLEEPLHQARIQRRTLDAMFEAVSRNADWVRDAARVMAKCHGKAKLDPWDLLAPAPMKDASTVAFPESLRLIRDSFATVDGSMGDFVKMMADNRWLEARVLPNKQGGAYCTGFIKSRTPRVFQTYMGSFADTSTLAHELGHAYHSWVMRDLPLTQLNYPMTLAETASIFCETVLTDHLMETAADKEAAFKVAYSEAEGAVALLLNIPARFEFEKSFYEARGEATLTPDELSELTDRAWTKWYGDCLTMNEKMFWATKLHFSIAGVSFYNFPYTFGYLFALSIYARRQEYGANFLAKYQEILRDTGRMTAEELVMKHFNEDLGSVEYWQKSLNVVKAKLETFKSLAAERL